MNRRLFAVLLVFALVVVLLPGCKGKPKEAPVAPPETGVTEHPSTTPMVESPTIKPITETPVSELPDDLDQINRSGLLKKVYFDFDRADLRADAIETLNANAAVLKKHSTLRIRIEGHCDERGTEEYNIGLGDRRAKAAYNYLVNLGVSAGRMETVSYGKSQPEDPSHNEDAWARNRRDVFLVVAK